MNDRRAEWMLLTGSYPRLVGSCWTLRWTGRWRWTWAVDRYPEGIVRRWWIGPWMLKYRRALDED